MSKGNQVMTKYAHWWTWSCNLHGCMRLLNGSWSVYYYELYIWKVPILIDLPPIRVWLKLFLILHLNEVPPIRVWLKLSLILHLNEVPPIRVWLKLSLIMLILHLNDSPPITVWLNEPKKWTFVCLCVTFSSIFFRKNIPRLPMQITWPWPQVGRFSHGLITVRQMKMWT